MTRASSAGVVRRGCGHEVPVRVGRGGRGGRRLPDGSGQGRRAAGVPHRVGRQPRDPVRQEADRQVRRLLARGQRRQAGQTLLMISVADWLSGVEPACI